MKLQSVRFIRDILASNQMTFRGDQLGAVIAAVNELNEEEQRQLRAAQDAEINKRVDEKIRVAIKEAESQVPAGTKSAE